MNITRRNHELVEVACALIFQRDLNPWDSTFFGTFYEKIQPFGFTDKEEKRVFEFKIEHSHDSEEIPIPETKVSESQMIFKNRETQSAIVFGNNLISFNQLQPYNGWDDLIDRIAKPALKIYKELGLGKGSYKVQALYLNKFTLHRQERISDYFRFMPDLNDLDYEKELKFESHYKANDDTEVLLKVNTFNDPSKGTDANKLVLFECSCHVDSKQDLTHFEEIASKAHLRARKVFMDLTTEIEVSH